MASASSRGGGPVYGGAAPYRSQDRMSTRQVGAVGSDEIQLRIDPVHGDLGEEITGLRIQVRQRRNVAQEIDSEAKFQNDMLNQLDQSARSDWKDQAIDDVAEQGLERTRTGAIDEVRSGRTSNRRGRGAK